MNLKRPFTIRTSLLAILSIFLWTIVLGCSYQVASEDIGTVETTQIKLTHYQLHLSAENTLYWNYQEQFFDPTWISYSLTPYETAFFTESSIACDETQDIIAAIKVKPTKTPWAEAWDRASVVKQMNRILIENGVSSKTVRVRMIAHAIVASGWKQNVWNYNAWGVQQGSWDKAWYVMPTYEEDEDGEMRFVEDAAWRAFSGWEEAIDDFQERISPDSDRPAYRDAYAYLMTEERYFRNSKAYWEALGAGNYYTASKFTGDKFAKLCGGVLAILR